MTMRRFVIEAYVDPDGIDATGSWVEHCQVYGRVERTPTLRGDIERLSGDGVKSLPTVRIHVDSTSETRAIDNTMRARDRQSGLIMNIQYVQDLDGMDRKLVITATENAPS